MIKFRTFFRKNFWFILLLLVVLAHLGISLRLALYWYDNFNLGKYDLGNVVQVVNNTLEGRFFSYTDRFGTQISRLSDHADFILLLLVPVFAIFPSPLTLVVAQCLALSLGGVVVFLLAREVGLSKIAATFIALAYLLNPEVGFLALDAFHGITFAIPFVLLTFYFLERYLKVPSRKKLFGLAVSIFLVLISKEEASLLVALLGFYIFFFRKKRELGAIIATAGFLWFVSYFFVVSPFFGPQREASIESFAGNFPELVPEGFGVWVVRESSFLSRYSHLGSSYSELLLSPFRKPLKIARLALNREYLLRILAPLGFLPLFSPEVLLLGLPEYLINTLAKEESMVKSILGMFHYVSLIIPVLFYAVILGLRKISQVVRVNSERIVTLCATWVLVNALLFAYLRQNPVLANPISIASKRLEPAFQEFSDRYGYRLPTTVGPGGGEEVTFDASQKKQVIKKEPTTKKKPKAIPEAKQKARLKKRAVYILNPKISGGLERVYELLKDSPGAISGPSSLGANLAIREDYNLFPIRWREADYIAADFTGAPKSYGSVSVVLGGKTLVGVVDFLRKSLNEINSSESHGVVYSGNGLVLFEQGTERGLFDTLPNVYNEEEAVGSGRGLVFRNPVFPAETRRGEEISFEIGWAFEEEYSAQKLLEVMPILALARKGSQEASFYDAVYGLYLFLEDFKPHRVRQVVKIPTDLTSGEYEICFGWHEPVESGMIGHAKLKDAVKLGSVKIE